jgi:hypothetical protein
MRMSIAEQNGSKSRRPASRMSGFARGFAGIANLFLWPFYADVLERSVWGLSVDTAKHIGLVLGCIAIIAWLRSFRAGLLLQVLIMLILVAATVW